MAIALLGAAIMVCVPAKADLGLEWVTNGSGRDSHRTKTAEAVCPSGTFAFGGGAFVTGGDGRVMIKGVYPDSLYKVVAIATEDEVGTSDDWKLHVQVICGKNQIQQVRAQSAADSSNFKTVVASCPGRARVVGAMGVVFSGGNQVVLDGFYPDRFLTAVKARAYEVPGGLSGKWQLDVYAMCALSPISGLERVIGKYGEDSNSFHLKQATKTCPARKSVLGLGAAIRGGNGSVYFEDLTFRTEPFEFPNQVYARAREGADGYDGSWDLRVYAICAFP